jgi:hypothetical protein
VLHDLEPFVGEWRLAAHFENLPVPDGDSDARVVFEWMPGEQFLIERWEIPIPEAPDGIALIGADPADPGGFLQHYFDSRGVARVYKMAFDGRVWTLWRDEPDFTSLEFRQRFTGTFNDDGRTIDGTWEICHDGSTWEKDFDITYTRR